MIYLEVCRDPELGLIQTSPGSDFGPPQGWSIWLVAFGPLNYYISSFGPLKGRSFLIGALLEAPRNHYRGH